MNDILFVLFLAGAIVLYVTTPIMPERYFKRRKYTMMETLRERTRSIDKSRPQGGNQEASDFGTTTSSSREVRKKLWTRRRDTGSNLY